MAEDNALEIVVVNLERSADRRAKMIETLGPLGLPYSFFDAVEGRNGHPLFEKFDPRLAEIRRGFILNAGELGCYASHYLLWERSVRDDKALLIFEDDVSIDGNFLEAYRYAADKIGTYGLIRFSGHKQRSFRVCETSGSGMEIIRFKIGPHGTSCYAVSPEAAAKLLAKADVWFEPVDCHLDRFWTHGVGSYGISPLPVTHTAEAAEQSDIWQGTTRERKSRRFRKLRAIYRAGDDIGRFVWNLPNIGRWQQRKSNL
ncbi:glycosyltransferase family 25 protein [Neorhizobium sp. T25_13]|uniref:glycosyltransferase family 25 protein n=1 Tax=Neorhizobium sp. T25_13 TaxID=2093830 RepID=UPI000CF8763F|nr:glycosyltransferase family 25 protein [Neorhizobium sp. T25_13]